MILSCINIYLRLLHYKIARNQDGWIELDPRLAILIFKDENLGVEYYTKLFIKMIVNLLYTLLNCRSFILTFATSSPIA